MKQQADQYFADHASSLSETERLNGLCKIYDTWTQARFIEAGLKSGDKVAEIGFGTGSMLRWLSQRVGAEGCVHGYDLTPRFIGSDQAFLAQSNVELFEHNIQTTPMPKPQYDFVYTRLVLAHLIDPEKAMQNMLAGLKSGGKLIALDYDSLVVHADADMEDAREFDQAVQRINKEIGAQGLLSASYGAEMTGHMMKIGLIDISNTIMERYHVGGKFEALLSAEGIELLGQARPETVQQTNYIAKKMRTPGFAYRDTDMHCAVGTKPAN